MSDFMTGVLIENKNGDGHDFRIILIQYICFAQAKFLALKISSDKEKISYHINQKSLQLTTIYCMIFLNFAFYSIDFFETT